MASKIICVNLFINFTSKYILLKIYLDVNKSDYSQETAQKNPKS